MHIVKKNIMYFENNFKIDLKLKRRGIYNMAVHMKGTIQSNIWFLVPTIKKQGVKTWKTRQ